MALIRLLEEKVWESDTAKLVDVISRNVDYMKSLVEKTLSLAILSSIDVQFHIRETSIGRMVDDLLKRKQYHTSKHRIVVDNRVRPDLIVACDELRIVEVFDNLTSNAIKFMPEGGTLTLDASEDKGFVTVTITDTGIGLNAEQQSRVFDEFYKVDESRHDLGSVGLGLTICKRIIEHHGGRIWAESEGTGKGATFCFTVLAHEAPKRYEPSRISDASATSL